MTRGGECFNDALVKYKLDQCFKNRTGLAGRTGQTANWKLADLVQQLDRTCNQTALNRLEPEKSMNRRFTQTGDLIATLFFFKKKKYQK
jgi:hypothetical protein